VGVGQELEASTAGRLISSCDQSFCISRRKSSLQELYKFSLVNFFGQLIRVWREIWLIIST